MSLIPTLWDPMVASFEAVELTPEAYADLIETQEALALPAVGTLSVDPGSGDLVHAEIAEETSEQLRLRSAWMVRRAGALKITDVEEQSLFESQADGDSRFSWLLAIDRARESGLPLIADDVVIRALATGHGVPSFSTVSWLMAHTEDGHIEEATAKDALRDLSRSFVVDLPMTSADILELAAENSYQVGPASAILTRASTWSNLDDALRLYGNLLELAEAEDRGLIPHWLASGAIGLASIHRPGLEAVGVGILLGSTINATSATQEETAEWLETVRQTMKLQSYEVDPLNALVWHLARKYVAEFNDTGGIVRLRIQLSGLSEADQFSALRTLDKFTGRSAV